MCRRVAAASSRMAASHRAQMPVDPSGLVRPLRGREKRITQMNTQKVTNPNPQVNSGASASDVTKLSPAEAVAQLRVFGSQVPDIAPLTNEERKVLRTFARIPRPVVRAQVRVIGASEAVQQAVGQPEENVRQWIDDEEGWNEVEDELRALLKGVADEPRPSPARRSRGDAGVHHRPAGGARSEQRGSA